ncbi:endonuclease/exonuclease/phosphatase family protein [Haliangium sp.]|uniref:endonuclease/exonuclease/phosphatase family protein n=1 Tax=Haliangium sp. TaxID=2663208 RepID=UPI003D0E8E7F
MTPFRFAWWNTKLSPPGGKPASPEKQTIAAEVVRALIDDHGVQLLALGEVSMEDLKSLRRACRAPLDYTFEVPTTGNKRGSRLAILHHLEMVELREVMWPRVIWLGNPMRPSLQARVYFQGELVNCFVLHWPSNFRDDAAAGKRQELARDLRRTIHELPDPEARVLVLGDFNAEPFSAELNEGLKASRDRDRARAKHLLYNPCWRLLGEQQTLGEETERRRGAGTYYYRQSGQITRWFTMDQMLVSSALLSREQWHLDEGTVEIWQEPPLANIRRGTPVLDFDHYPIVGSLRAPTAAAGRA